MLNRVGKQAEHQAAATAATAATTAPKRARWADRLGLVDSSSARSSAGPATATPAHSVAQTGQQAARPAARGPAATPRAAPAAGHARQERAPRPVEVARPGSKGSSLDSSAQRPAAVRAVQGPGERASVRPVAARAAHPGTVPPTGALLAEEAAKRRRRVEKFGRWPSACSRQSWFVSFPLCLCCTYQLSTLHSRSHFYGCAGVPPQLHKQPKVLVQLQLFPWVCGVTLDCVPACSSLNTPKLSGQLSLCRPLDAPFGDAGQAAPLSANGASGQLRPLPTSSLLFNAVGIAQQPCPLQS